MLYGLSRPDMQFVYVLPGWEGSVADGRVLRDAISRRHGLKVPHAELREGLPTNVIDDDEPNISHKEATQFKHQSFRYYEQLIAIYAKDQATGKDSQTTTDIIEEINVKDIPTINTHEERNNPHGCKADISLDDMDLSATQPQLARNQENIQTVGLEISKSIAFEVLIQQKLEMTIQESALKLYPTLCEVEGLTKDEHYRTLSKLLDHLTQTLIFFSLPFVVRLD
ncbi:hypothetical protein J1N35_004854 [Gossypium stocksii]|uniref:Uncharacterized protein n=1 Tax=Gossypium stocksii TaxID=47602 RepID=A0A9D3WBR8_9ROSI|nr:hypothetical protein J1N35_004854 [Gossypium stocksii]